MAVLTYAESSSQPIVAQITRAMDIFGITESGGSSLIGGDGNGGAVQGCSQLPADSSFQV